MTRFSLADPRLGRVIGAWLGGNCKAMALESCDIFSDGNAQRTRFVTQGMAAVGGRYEDWWIFLPRDCGGIMANPRDADFLYDNLVIETNVIHAACLAVKKLFILGSSCIIPAWRSNRCGKKLSDGRWNQPMSLCPRQNLGHQVVPGFSPSRWLGFWFQWCDQSIMGRRRYDLEAVTWPRVDHENHAARSQQRGRGKKIKINSKK